MIAVAVQSANGDLFLRSFELPVDLTVIGTAFCLDTQSAVGPQRPLGAKTVRGLQNTQQYGGTDRTDRGDLAEQFPRRVFLPPCHQPPALLFTSRPQRIELWVENPPPPAHSRFRDLS